METYTPGPYVGRETSWLDFNYRVLEEAYDKSNQIMDRFKFLAITASNLDEFFSVRIAGLEDQISVGYNKKGSDGLTPAEQLADMQQKTHEMMKRQYQCLNKSLLPELEQEDIHFVHMEDVDGHEENYLTEFFNEVLYPVLTPQAVDSARPFPLISANLINICVQLTDPDEEKEESAKKKKKKKNDPDLFAIISLPKVLPRVIELPKQKKDAPKRYILLEEVVKAYAPNLFPGYKVKNVSEFRITRNADLAIDEDEAEDLLIEIEKSIQKRKWGQALRLEIPPDMNKKMKKLLVDSLEIEENEIYELPGPLDLTMFMKFSGRPEFSELRQEVWQPVQSPDFYGKDDYFEVIREKDRLLHHPFESFDTVVNFVRKAANDPNVLAIKQTLYRVSGDSPIIDALIQAAKNGKAVTVLVELKARFDEENNIVWAKKLEKAGCHVIYGLPGLKIHCKMILVVRKEDDAIRRYVHLGTGNYNDVTAGMYTDIGMFSARESLVSDVSTLFNLLSGYSKYDLWRKLEVAPYTLRSAFVQMIDREIENVKNGSDGLIVAKMNALIDEEIVQKLYEASQAGVKIHLIVRGMCSLIPGIEGISDNIEVHSIVGEFLEHSRIYYFFDNGREHLYLASADWMQRNLNRRIETMFPVEDPEVRQKVMNILDVVLRDTVKSRVLQSDGTYTRIDKRGKVLLSSQDAFKEQATEALRNFRQSNPDPTKSVR